MPMTVRARLAILAGLAPVSLALCATAAAQAGPAPQTARPAATAAAATDGRPNILAINLDDARFDVLKTMPKTASRLLATGTIFPQMTVAIPSCCPSRADFFSGQYPHNTGVRHQGDGLNLDQSHTFQAALRAAGYATGIDGKFMTSYPGTTPPNWDHMAVTHGSYRYDGQYNTIFFMNDLMKWVDSVQGKPWLAYYAPQVPHTAKVQIDGITYHRAIPEPKYANTAVPPCLQPGEADKSDKPSWVAKRNFVTSEIAAICQSMERAELTADDMIAGALDHLAATGQLANTLVIFTSDNGYCWGEHNLQAKFVPYDCSIRVPLVMSWPGHIPAGATDNRLVSTADLAPTIMAAAGITPTWTVDGRSLLGSHARPFAYSEYWLDSANTTRVPGWTQVRTRLPQYGNRLVNFIEWRDAANAVTFREFYDLTADPGQLTNRLGDTDKSNDPSADVIAQLVAMTDTAQSCQGSSCP